MGDGGGCKMKTSNLIKSLENLIAEHGDCHVRLECDHGQCLMSPTWTGISFIHIDSVDDWMIEDVCDEDKDIDDFSSAVPVITIQAY